MEIDQSIPKKFFDLDRCYSVNRIPTENGNYLCVFNVHLTAYGGDESIRTGQFMVCEETTAERSPSVRDNDIPYTPGTSFVATVDGFIVSDNVEVIALDNADLEFLYSDHNPVVLEFVLK